VSTEQSLGSLWNKAKFKIVESLVGLQGYVLLSLKSYLCGFMRDLINARIFFLMFTRFRAENRRPCNINNTILAFNKPFIMCSLLIITNRSVEGAAAAAVGAEAGAAEGVSTNLYFLWLVCGLYFLLTIRVPVQLLLVNLVSHNKPI